MIEFGQSETVRRPSTDPAASPLEQAAEVACAYLAATQQERRNKAYEVFLALLSATLERSRKQASTRFTALNLQEAVSPDAAKEPSGWLSPLWNRLLQDEPQWTEGLIETARSLDRLFIPKLRKSPGSPALYSIEAVSIPARDSESEPVPPVPGGGVRYTPAAVTAPGAWLGGALKSGVLRWTLGARLAFLFLIVGGGVAAIALVWLGVTAGIRTTQPLNLRDLLFLGLLGGVCWVASRVFRFLDQLFDLRIVLAPSFLTSMSEDHVTLELRRASPTDEVGELAFVRYTATCPTCGGSIDIQSGGTAFPGRLVGRCRRSAREHVFSFDPALRVGRALF